jgi:peptide/nickel transport system substrate-binding protein
VPKERENVRKTLVTALVAVFVIAAVGVWANPKSESQGAATTTAVATGRYHEAPMLAALVASGQLPPVQDRLPKNPKVAEMIEGVGKYGGELKVFATDENIWEADLQGQMGSSALRIPRNGIGFEPDLAEGFEISADKTTITLFLREGLKWSDGHPLTTEDIRFEFEDMHYDPNVATWGQYSIDSIQVVDDYTIKLISPEGLGVIPFALADWQGGFSQTYQPAHYLKKWHLKYNTDADKLAKEEGFEHWYDALYNHYFFAPLRDLNKPQIEPWDQTQFTPTAKVMERNPYFWRVDPAGNQLPYIDRVIIQIVNNEVYQLKVSGGEASIAYYRTNVDSLPLYKAGEAAGNFRTVLFPSVTSATMKFIPEGRWHKEPAIRQLFNQLDFRRALSVALNRNEVNDIIYHGLGKPGQPAPLESVSYYQRGWRTDYAQYDPALANRLLDGVGLNKKDSEGFRLLPNGEKFTFVITYSADRWTAELELYKEYYEDVGIRTVIRLVDATLMGQQLTAGELMAWVHNNPLVPHSPERKAFSDNWTWWQGSGPWGRWQTSHEQAIRSTLKEGENLPVDYLLLKAPATWQYPANAEEPSQQWKEMRTLALKWQLTDMGTPEYTKMGIDLYNYLVRDWFMWIGAVGELPTPIVAKNNLGNVMKPGWVNGLQVSDLLMQTWMDQLYWK